MSTCIKVARNALSLSALLASPRAGQPVIAVLDHDPKRVGRAVAGVQVMGMPNELDAVITEFAIHGIHTDRVIVAGEVDYLGEAASQEIERICQKRQVELQFLPRLIGVTEWKGQEAAAVARIDVDMLPSPPAYFWF